jgi:uncharacterized membrane protein YqjE
MTDLPPDPPPASAADPLLQLVARVPREVQELVEAEVRLASAEMRSNLQRLAVAFALILAGGIVFGIAGISVLGAVVAALAPVVGPVWSAIITAIVALVAGGALMAAGILRMRNGPLAPRQSITNIQKHIESLKRKTDGTAKG